MAKATYLSQPIIMRIPSLLQEIRDRATVIPRFQRPFVWTDQQRLELMESIYSGIPIGSLLVWRTRAHLLATYRLRGTRDSNRPLEDGNYQYVLDGHQRIITLYTVLGPGLLGAESDDSAAEESETALIEDDDYHLDTRRPIYFDLTTKEFVLGRKGNIVRKIWFPLSQLFDDYGLYEFQRELADDPDGKRLMLRVRNLHKAFLDYTIAVVPIVTDDIDMATMSFERVNNAGTSLSEVHMVSALTYIMGFDLNQRMEELREELGEVGWQDIEEQLILDVCKARLDLPVHLKGVSPLVDRLKRDRTLLDDARDAIVLAARFLARACDIHGPKTLPYSYQLVLLADVLWADQRTSADLDGKLATWLWATSYGEYFASMNATRLRIALDHLREVVAGNAEPVPDGLPDEILPPRRFDFRAARSRAMALTMADCKPVSSHGKPYKAYQMLADYGKDATPKLLSSADIGREDSQGFENRIIAKPTDTQALRRALQQGRLDPQGLRSHGITPQAAKALRDGRHKEFLAQRRAYLLDKEKSFVEKELKLSYVLRE